MKRFIRYVSMLMVAVLLVTSTAFAAEPIEPRGSRFFICASVYLYRENANDRTFAACFDVTGTHIMEKIGASVLKIQRSSDGVNWTTMKTYRMSAYPEMICENTAQHDYYFYYTGTAGYYYRMYVELYAEDSSGIGIWDEYSSKILLS